MSPPIQFNGAATVKTSHARYIIILLQHMKHETYICKNEK